jgi:hypothetical protein
LYRPLVGLARLADAAGDGRLLDDLGHALQASSAKPIGIMILIGQRSSPPASDECSWM